MNERNILALYPARAEAERVKARLQAAGIAAADIDIYQGPSTEGIDHLIEEVKAFSDRRRQLEPFARGVSKGGVLLTAKVGDESAPTVFNVLQGTSPLDVDAVEGEWRRPGRRKTGTRDS